MPATSAVMTKPATKERLVKAFARKPLSGATATCSLMRAP